MGRFILYKMLVTMGIVLASCLSGCKLQSINDSTSQPSFNWIVISDSMMSKQLGAAAFAYDAITQNRETRKNSGIMDYLSNNALKGDTIVFIEPIDGLYSCEPWNYFWISNKRDTVFFYRRHGIDFNKNLIVESHVEKVSDLLEVNLCKSLDADSLAFLHEQSPYAFDAVNYMMGTRVVLNPDYSFKIDCIQYEFFIFPEYLDDLNHQEK